MGGRCGEGAAGRVVGVLEGVLIMFNHLEGMTAGEGGVLSGCPSLGKGGHRPMSSHLSFSPPHIHVLLCLPLTHQGIPGACPGLTGDTATPGIRAAPERTR